LTGRLLRSLLASLAWPRCGAIWKAGLEEFGVRGRSFGYGATFIGNGKDGVSCGFVFLFMLFLQRLSLLRRRKTWRLRKLILLFSTAGYGPSHFVSFRLQSVSLHALSCYLFSPQEIAGWIFLSRWLYLTRIASLFTCSLCVSPCSFWSSLITSRCCAFVGVVLRVAHALHPFRHSLRTSHTQNFCKSPRRTTATMATPGQLPHLRDLLRSLKYMFAFASLVALAGIIFLATVHSRVTTAVLIGMVVCLGLLLTCAFFGWLALFQDPRLLYMPEMDVLVVLVALALAPVPPAYPGPGNIPGHLEGAPPARAGTTLIGGVPDTMCKLYAQ
ncbi:hypothetical protein KCU71_g60, partial [Aureobasidium melanogenum]